MKKRIITSILTVFLATQAFSASGSSTLLEQVRAEKVEIYKNNLDAIVTRANSYILNTGDIDLTRKKIQEFDGLPYQFFNNFEAISCTNDGEFCEEQTGADGIQIELTEKSIVLKNVLGTNPNSYVIKAFTSNNDNSKAISKDDNYTVTIPLDTKTKSFISLIDKIKDNSDIYVGTEPPSDTSKTWYFPNGNGGFDIKKWNPTTNKWENVGSTSNNGETSIHASSEDELLEIPCVKNDKAFVINKATATQYLCSQDGEWAMVSGGGSSAFNGASDMLNLVTKLMKKTGGSVADVSDPNIATAKQAFAGNLSFTKKDNSANNGYWSATGGNGVEYIATDTYEVLKTINSIDGSYAFLPNVSKSGVDTLIRYQNRWLYLADSYTEIVSYFTFVPEDGFATIKNVGTGYKITGKGQFFKRVGNYFVSQSDASTEDYKVMMTLSDRNTFNSSSGHQVYLVANNDCTVDSCNGVGGTYAGAKVENMFAFYYTTGGKHKNNLTDAIPVSSVAIAYSTGGWAHILTSNSGEILNGSVLLKYPTNVNGEICYTFDDKFVIINGIVVQEHLGNKILNKTCGGTTYPSFTGNGTSEQAIIVNSLNDFVGADVPVGYKINIPNKEGIDGTITYCKDSGFTSGSTGEQVWSDACSNLSGAKYAITNGSREDLSSPSNSNRINLTLDVGLKLQEDRYTTDGVQYLSNSNFKQWFYSLTGTNVNLMLDAIIPTATYAYSNGNGTFGYTAGNTKNAYRDTTAKNVGYAYLNSIVAKYDGTYWRKLGSTGKVLSGDFAQEINDNIIAGVAGNGLLYTKDNVAPFTNSNSQTLQGHFGVTTWSVEAMNSVNPRGNTTNICESIGMLLPLLSETTGTNNPWGGLTYVPSGGSMGSSNGVPSHANGWTWTSTSWTNGTSYYWLWNGSDTNGGDYSYSGYVRCVR